MTTYRKGADPEQLARIASNIRGLQAELTRIESTSSSAMGAIQRNWGGDNLHALARQFTTTCVPGIQACNGVLDAMARRIDDNVRAQQAASGGAGGPGGPGESTGPGQGGGLNDVTKMKGKKHDVHPFTRYTHGWKDTEHGEHEHSAAAGLTKDKYTHRLVDLDKDRSDQEREAARDHRTVDRETWQVRNRDGKVIGEGFNIKAEGEHLFGDPPAPGTESADPNQPAGTDNGSPPKKPGIGSKLLGAGLEGVNWTEKNEHVDSSYTTTYYDANGNPTDKEHAAYSQMGGTLGTETKHHTEYGIKDGALYAGVGAGAGAYLLRGSVDGNLGDHGRYNASGFVGAEAKADAGVSLGKDGLTAKGSAEAFAGAKGEAGVAYDNGVFGGQAGVNAMAGAEAKADASLGIGLDGVKSHAGASAFAGVKAGADLGANVAGIGGTAGGEVYAGIGGHANIDANLSAESVKVKVDVGAALGVGGGVKFSVDVQPKEFVNDVGHGLGQGVEGAGHALEGGFKATTHTVGKLFGW
ncbi:hypothetical protein GCM10027053_27760 [Intrasporangium mesophilum]